MIGKVIRSYLQCLQDFYNPFDIVFDTFYNQNIESYRQAMDNFNLRQMYDFDSIKSLKLTEDIINSLKSDSYNCLSYKYSPLRRYSNHPNSNYYYVRHDSETGKIGVSENLYNRKWIELDKDTEKAIQSSFEEYQRSLSITNPERVMQRSIQHTLSSEVKPEMNTTDPKEYIRLGFYGEIELECRLLTTSTDTFEQFQILYNTFLCKRNPPAYAHIKEFGDVKYPIRTEYDDISDAGQVEQDKLGNLLQVSFSVKLSAFILSAFVKKQAVVNAVDIFIETRSN